MFSGWQCIIGALGSLGKQITTSVVGHMVLKAWVVAAGVNILYMFKIGAPSGQILVDLG